MADIDSMVDAERTRLLVVLDGLDEAQWRTPSLCTGWTVRDVVVHLLMPYELSVPRFLVRMAAARFDFDRAADRWATGDRRSAAEVVAALRATKHGAFRIPGAPAQAPLSHLMCHAEDIYRPLGIRHRPDPVSADVVLDQLVSPRGRGTVNPGLLDGFHWTSTDTNWNFGEGAPITGSASALITTLIGRPAALDELSGEGAARVRACFER